MTDAEIEERYGCKPSPSFAGVQHIPPRTSSFVYPVWSATKNALVSGMTREELIARQKRISTQNLKRTAHVQKLKDGKAERMERVRALFEAGLTQVEVCNETGFSEKAVRDYRYKMGIKLQPRRYGPSQETLERIENVKQLAAAGLPIIEIARKLGCAPKTVSGIGRAHGIAFPKSVRKQKAAALSAKPKKKSARDRGALQSREAITAQVLERKAQVRAMRDEGLSSGAIAERLGCGIKTVTRYISEMGLPSLRSTPEQIAERRAKICDLRAQGKTVNEIAAAIGFTVSLVWDDLKRMGAEKPAIGERKRASTGRAKAVSESERKRLEAQCDQIRVWMAESPQPTTRVMAERMGCSQSTIHKAMRRAGIEPDRAKGGPKRTAWAVEQQIRDLRAGGKMIKEIVAETGFSKSAVNRVLRGH